MNTTTVKLRRPWLRLIGALFLSSPSLLFIGPLRAAMGSSDMFVRTYAAAALRDMGPDATAAVSELIAGLREGERSISWNCADALGRIGPAASSAVPELLKALEELPPVLDGGSESSLRPRVIRALGKIGPDARASVPVLERLLQAGTESEREEAFFALPRVLCTEKTARPIWEER